MTRFDDLGPAVVMCGISGSGKTHYARQIEEAGYVRLSADALIWEKAGRILGSLSEGERHQLFAECRREILSRLGALLKEGKKVVVDSTQCKRATRDEIRTVCLQAGVRPVFVYCHADKDELLARVSKRRGTGPDDLIVTPRELSAYWLGFERPQPDEHDFISPDF